MTCREASKKEWNNLDRDKASDEEITTGSLQRIADACEKMCLDRERLERSRDAWKRSYEQAWDHIEHRDRQISALKGIITKLKKRLQEPSRGH